MANNSSSDPWVGFSLSDFFLTTSLGAKDQSMFNTYYGINHRQTPLAVPMNKDVYGLTFFTRPQLNFSADNLRRFRKFYPLLGGSDVSIQRYIRCMLDPRLQYGYADFDRISCPLVDTNMAFIPVLTNQLETVTGWPETSVPMFTSKTGNRKEEFSMVDGIMDNFSSYDLHATFRNSRGDVINNMFHYWTWYSGCVFDGVLLPYSDMLISNEIDYNTRIYRIILDSSKRYVQKLMCSGASIVGADVMASAGDYTKDKPYSDANESISMNFRSTGFFVNDPIIIRWFNECVQIFHPLMRDDKRTTSMVKIPINMLDYFNSRGYPYINPTTYELEWWLEANLVQEKLGFLNSIRNTLGTYVLSPVDAINTQSASTTITK